MGKPIFLSSSTFLVVKDDSFIHFKELPYDSPILPSSLNPWEFSGDESVVGCIFIIWVKFRLEYMQKYVQVM